MTKGKISYPSSALEPPSKVPKTPCCDRPAPSGQTRRKREPQEEANRGWRLHTTTTGSDSQRGLPVYPTRWPPNALTFATPLRRQQLGAAPPVQQNMSNGAPRRSAPPTSQQERVRRPPHSPVTLSNADPAVCIRPSATFRPSTAATALPQILRGTQVVGLASNIRRRPTAVKAICSAGSVGQGEGVGCGGGTDPLASTLTASTGSLPPAPWRRACHRCRPCYVGSRTRCL